MIYSWDISTAITYTKASPKDTILQLCEGYIHRVNFVFPAGCAGLAHLQIRDALHQIWPTNPDGDLAGDGESINFEDYYYLSEAPFELKAYTWNLDDTYPHIITIRIGILEAEYVAPWVLSGI
jgi:hypothetical protein